MQKLRRSALAIEPNLPHPRTGEHCRDASRILEAPPNPTGHNTTPTRSAKIDDPAQKISVHEHDEVSLKNTGTEKATLASTSMVESPHNATPNLRAKRSTPSLPPTQVTSTPCERLFSAAGMIVNKQRNSLLPENVNKLLCLSSWGCDLFSVDYRQLNAVTKKDVYLIPRIDDKLDRLRPCRSFSSVDLKSSYWQVEVDERDREKTAFVTPDGLYEFKVMPFGLCTVPATFQCVMDTVPAGLKWQSCLVSIDDVVVTGGSENRSTGQILGAKPLRPAH
ncbi:hypothetical protein ISCGN_011137 [Ixodes scapularis]